MLCFTNGSVAGELLRKHLKQSAACTGAIDRMRKEIDRINRTYTMTRPFFKTGIEETVVSVRKKGGRCKMTCGSN